MATKGRFHNLVEELKRRRVFRVATLYVVAMWPIIQIADILSPALDLPDGAMRTLLVVFIAGFPVAIIFAWVFNLTPKGLIKVGSGDPASEPVQEDRLFSKSTELLVVSVLLILAIGLFVFQGTMTDTPTSAISSVVDNKKIESIAVLPFVPFSENKQDEYFADGLSEELLNVLAKIKTLRVVARTSSFAYKGVSRNIQEVGEELGVDAILEGSVRRNDIDNTIRVTAQLIDIRTGAHLWSDTYDRKFEDIFKIQDEITSAVVGELKITLLGEERAQLMAHETANSDAMIAHSIGREELAKRTASSVELAAEYFIKAIAKDSEYATAYSSLAEAYILMISYSAKPGEEYRAKAQEAVDKALAIDNKLGLAWAAQGLIYYSADDSKKALQALEKAIELNPSYAMAYMWYGSLQEDKAKMMEYHQKAFQLNPKSAVAGYNVASNYVNLGRDSDAMDVFSKIIEADPFFPGAYMLVGEINESHGRIDQAIMNYKKSYELGETPMKASQIASLYINLGDVAQAREWIAVAETNASKSYKDKFAWLNYSAYMIEGKALEARKVLSDLKDVKSSGMRDYYNAVLFNYWLGDYPQAIRQFENAEAIRIEKSIDVLPKGTIESYIYAAYAYQQLEQDEKSNALIELVNAEQDKLMTSGGRIDANIWYQKSLIQAIEGESQMALITLQRAIDEGWIQQVRISVEPLYKNLKSDTNFKAMVTGLEAKINLMREQLAYEESFPNHWKS